MMNTVRKIPGGGALARCAASLMIGLAVAASALAGEVNWQPLDFAAASRKAGQEGKLVYVVVEGDNCPPCDAFKASHFSDPAYIDFVNTLYVPLKAHQSDPDGRAFLESLKLVHAAVPRFYVLTAEGRGVSMSIGMVMAPPMGAADVLKLAMGRELPVDRNAAAALGGRLRAHAASQRASGALYPDNPLRYLGVAVLEAQAWALAGRLDEAEKAFGAEWATQLADQEVREWYINFWLAWNRNAKGALEAAKQFRAVSPDLPAGAWLQARASAANGMFDEAVRLGEEFRNANPGVPRIGEIIAEWRDKAGK